MFQSRRQECEIDRCAANGYRCITEYNAPNTTTDCLAWCCKADNNMLIVLIIICVLVFLALVTCILFIFFYCCRKKDAKRRAADGALTEDAIQERQLELAEEARLEKERRAKEALEASKPPQPKSAASKYEKGRAAGGKENAAWMSPESPKHSDVAENDNGGYTTNRTTARAAAAPAAAPSTKQPLPGQVAPTPSTPSTARDAAPAITVSSYESSVKDRLEASSSVGAPVERSTNLASFPPRGSTASTAAPPAAEKGSAVASGSYSYIQATEDTPQRGKPADDSMRFFASPMAHETQAAATAASPTKENSTWRQQAKAAASAPPAPPAVSASASSVSNRSTTDARGAMGGTESFGDNDYGYNSRPKPASSRYVPGGEDDEAQATAIGNAWSRPAPQQAFPMPGDDDFGAGYTSYGRGAGMSAPSTTIAAQPQQSSYSAPAAMQAPSAPAASSSHPVSDAFGDLDFGVDVGGGDFDDGFDF
jgi:hypothetical protein